MAADWKLVNFEESDESTGIDGYSVLDALGLRVGHVSGWVIHPSGGVVMLKTTIRDWFKTRDYLVPIGAVTLVNDIHRQLQLRQLTRRALIKQCIQVTDELPAQDVLEELIQYFPNPRPVVAERLNRGQELLRQPTWSRLTIQPDQGDGLPFFALGASIIPGPNWTKLGRLTPPLWKPLKNLFFRSRS